MYIISQLGYSKPAMSDETNHSKKPAKDSPQDLANSNEKPAGQESGLHTIALRNILRARTRLIVCFWTLPVYMIALWALLNNGRNIESFMFIYMALWAGFAVDMALRRCPECGNQFFVKSILLNLFTQRCVHCGLSQHREEDRQEF